MKALAVVGGALAGAVVAAVLTLNEREKNAVSRAYNSAKDRARDFVDNLRDEEGSLSVRSIVDSIRGEGSRVMEETTGRGRGRESAVRRGRSQQTQRGRGRSR